MLKELREKAGLSQKDLADHLGLSSAQFISNIERGVCNIPVKSIKKIATKLNVSPLKLVDYNLERERNKILKQLRLKQ